MVVPATGAVLGADVAGARWTAVNNTAIESAFAGYLVVDGAHDNLLANNHAFDSANLDIYLTGPGDVFGTGVCLPGTYDNVVAQGSQKGLRIMDCGENNTVSGDVTLVPCVPALTCP
jgi:hypothetical protein